MICKLSEIVLASQSLNNILNTPLELKTAYNIMLLIDKFNIQMQFFESERNKIINSDASEQDKNSKFNELCDLEVSIEYEAININTNENIMISVQDMIALKKFIYIET